MVKLFDDRPRTDTGPAAFAEGRFAYYNRSARPDVARVRELIERWLDAYPPEAQEELVVRLREDGGAFEAAFFELYVYSVLRSTGHDIALHPEVPGTANRPDFLAQPITGGEPCYVEAVVASDESDEKRVERIFHDRIQDDLNTLQGSDFWLIVAKLEGRPASYPRRARLHEFVRATIEGLDADDVAGRIVNGEDVALTLRRRFTHDGLVLELYPWPKSPAARGERAHRVVGMGPVRVIRPTAREAIRAAVKKKAGRYGDLPHPYIVAVNAVSPWVVDEVDVREALLGREQIILPSGGGEPTLVYDGEGAFTHLHKPTNTRVSAVLACRDLAPNSVLTADVRLYHHIAPKRPYAGPLDLLSHVRRVGETLQHFPSTGASPEQLFDLPYGWPQDPGPVRS